jgi:hypothetical protein
MGLTRAAPVPPANPVFRSISVELPLAAQTTAIRPVTNVFVEG